MPMPPHSDPGPAVRADAGARIGQEGSSIIAAGHAELQIRRAGAATPSTVGLFVFVVLAWSLNWVVMKLAVHDISPLWAVTARTALATVVLIPALGASGQLILPRRADLPIILVIALLHMVAFAALIVIANEPLASRSIEEPILVRVIAARYRLGNAPDHHFHERTIVENEALALQQGRLHAGNKANISLCCQSCQHSKPRRSGAESPRGSW